MCPMCLFIVAGTERDLLEHMLDRHPLALAILVGILTVGNIALADRPEDLLLVDAAILVVAVGLTRGHALGR